MEEAVIMELARFKSILSERRIGVYYDELTHDIRLAYHATGYDAPRYVTLSDSDMDDLITTLQYARHLQETND